MECYQKQTYLSSIDYLNIGTYYFDRYVHMYTYQHQHNAVSSLHIFEWVKFEQVVRIIGFMFNWKYHKPAYEVNPYQYQLLATFKKINILT